MSNDETKPQIPPTRTNKDLELLREAGRHLDKFLCQGDQRTDLDNSSVPLVSILDEWAKNPFPVSRNIASKHGIVIEKNKCELTFLVGFLDNYKKFRVSRDRLGRKEDKEVMMSYMRAIMDALQSNEKPPGYLK